MATTEHTINDAIAELLKETRRAWQQKDVVRSENIDILKSSGKRPDILVSESNVSPVVVETEIIPAVSVESDTMQRLGQQLAPSGKKILSALAVKLPADLRNYAGQSLKNAIGTISDFHMALYTGESPESCTRFPQNGWLQGNITDLSILIQSASIPQTLVDDAANKLVDGVTAAAAILNDMTQNHSGAIRKICEELKQQDDEQTRRMATTIIANALVFHESLSRGNGELYNVRTLYELKTSDGVNKTAVLNDWQIILKVNYWPIFDIARRILEVIPDDIARVLLERLIATASDLVANNLMRSHDLTGAVFQRLIADRKFLAAFYTHPASAALLVGLAINKEKTPAGGDWGNEKDVTSLRIADFACGTGTLLSTAYHRIGQLFEAAGGDSEIIHPAMMATALVGCDVLPAAAHLTASMLASAHPSVKYNGSSIMTVGYGTRKGGGVALGSLDLLDPQRAFDIVAITAKIAEGLGEKEKETWATLPHASFDMVIMNPPFTRDTDHSAIKAEVPNPMFAAFSSKAEEQREMSKAAKRLLQGTSAHGNAGEASSFLVLADRKLTDGGTLAMVMPLSLMFGEAWEASRQLLRKSYDDLVLITISGSKDEELSFSADTGMAECLVIGRKVNNHNARATFAVLNERPSSTLIGSSTAVQIHKLKKGHIRKLEDGPVGGSLLHFGDDLIGYAIDAALPKSGSWNLARIKDGALAQVAYQMADRGLVWLPGISEANAVPISITKVSAVGEVGPVHRDINGDTPEGGIRGPFKIEPLKTKSVPTYPILWSHDASRERHIEFEADSEGIIRQGANAAEDKVVKHKVDRIWATASHCHFNADFRFNSQSTAMQFTSVKTIGSSAWPAINLNNMEQEKILTLWGNSILGLLLHWWHANKQQAGRGRIGVSALTSLVVLDVTKLSANAVVKAIAIFDDIKYKELRPINEIDKDSERKQIDDRFYTEVLGFPEALLVPDGPLALLRKKLAIEPSVAGSKLDE